MAIYKTQLVHATAHGMLHNSSWHSEITALCGLWLRAAVALDETNDRLDNSKISDRSFIRSETIPVYGYQYRIRAILRSVHSLTVYLFTGRQLSLAL